MLLVLDFDSVLYRFAWLRDQPATESEPFVYLARLESVLREHPHVRIVIASDWRKHHTLPGLRRSFSDPVPDSSVYASWWSPRRICPPRSLIHLFISACTTNEKT